MAKKYKVKKTDTPSVIKSKWIEALLSGDFKQTKGKLMTANAVGRYHCCLGVLNEICGFPSNSKGEIMNKNGEYLLIEDQDQSMLSTMNDYQNKNFTDIAIYIKDNIKIKSWLIPWKK